MNILKKFTFGIRSNLALAIIAVPLQMPWQNQVFPLFHAIPKQSTFVLEEAVCKWATFLQATLLLS